jgi:hypothetical protein
LINKFIDVSEDGYKGSVALKCQLFQIKLYKMAMISPNIPLIMDPGCEIYFWGPFEDQVKASLKLQNCSDKPVLYKIKSKHSNHIIIRKNPGHLHPGEEVEIDIVLWHGGDIPDNKLMLKVLSTMAPSGNINCETIWEDIAEDDVMETLIEGHLVTPDEWEKWNAEEESGDEEEEDYEESTDYELA